MHHMRISQIKAGAILSYLNTFLNVIIGLLYVPLILRILSIEEYGLYQIVGAITAYLGLADLRLTTTTVRYYSQALATGNQKRQKEVLSTALIIFLSLSGLLVFFGFPIMKLFSLVYRPVLTTIQYKEGIIMIWLGIGTFALIFPTNVFTAIIDSHERFVFIRVFNMISAIFRPLLSYALLIMNPLAVILSVTQFIIAVFSLVGCYIYERGVLKIHIPINTFNKDLARDMLKFSFFLIIIAITDQIYWEAGKLFLGAIVGTASVAVFSFALQITRYYVTVSSSLNSLLFPKINRLVVSIEDNLKELNNLFMIYSRIQGIILVGVLTGFIIYGKRFIQLWIGNQFDQVYILTLSLIIPFTWDLTQNFGISVLSALNLNKYRAWLYCIVVLLYLGLCYPIIIRFGALGCAVLSGMCIFLSNGIGLAVLYSKLAHLKMKLYFFWMLKIMPIAIFTGICGWLLCLKIPIESWVGLFWHGLFFLIIYGSGIFVFYLVKEERESILSRIGNLINYFVP